MTSQNEHNVPVLHDNPTPEERAEYIIQRLEQFIRDGRSFSEGMNYKKWQMMARVEIANGIADAELNYQNEEHTTKRLLFTFASALVTIGFWGTSVSIHEVGNIGNLIGAIVCGVAGLLLMAVAVEWRTRIWFKKRKARKRAESLTKIEDLNKRVKRMEVQLDKRVKDLEKEIDESID